MAISYVTQVSAAATTATMPAHSIGDMLVVFAYRGSSGAPTLASGYTLASTATGANGSLTIGYKIATATNDAFGTWTLAGIVIGVIYQGATAIGATASQVNLAASTGAVPGLTLVTTDNTSWVAVFAGARTNSSGGMPAGTTTRASRLGTTAYAMASDTNGGVTTFASTTRSNGASVVSATASIELLEVAPVTGSGQAKLWNGTTWVAKPVKVWNGSAWVVKPMKYWNGTSWVTTPY